MRKIQEQLIEKELTDARIQEKEKSNTKTRQKATEQLSDWEWAEIMGSNAPTFRRAKGGAIRRNR